MSESVQDESNLQARTYQDSPRVAEMVDKASKPSLVGLAYALRHPDTWPEGFVWNYNDCNTCAMGLAYKLWLLGNQGDLHLETGATRPMSISAVKGRMARHFHISYDDAAAVFFDVRPVLKQQGFLAMLLGKTREGSIGDVTPEHVARVIDELIARGE